MDSQDERSWSPSTYKLCKRLCFLLRHAPGQRDLPIRRDGYVCALHVLAQPELKGVNWAQVLYVIRTNYKQRFGVAIQTNHYLAKKNSSSLLDADGERPPGLSWRGCETSSSHLTNARMHAHAASPSSRLSSYLSSSSRRSGYDAPPSPSEKRRVDYSTTLKQQDDDLTPGTEILTEGSPPREDCPPLGDAMSVPRRHTELTARQLPTRRRAQLKNLLGTNENEAGVMRQSSDECVVRGQFECDKQELSSDDESANASTELVKKSQQLSFGEMVIKLEPIEDLWDPRLHLDSDHQHPHSRGDDADGKLNLSRIWIRAHQGHSIQEVDARLSCVVVRDPRSQIPVCIHGTTFAAWKLIKEQGLSKMKRSHIHFARGLPANRLFKRTEASELSPRRIHLHHSPKVVSGIRQNSELAIFIDAEKCFSDGIEFYVASNGVILSPGDADGLIAPKYFVKILDLSTGHVTKLTS